MHLIKTTSELNNEILNMFKRYSIDFYIEEYYPSASWIVVILYLFGRILYFTSIYLTSRSIVATFFYIRKMRFEQNKSEKNNSTYFHDVAGCDEAKYELQEVIVNWIKLSINY